MRCSQTEENQEQRALGQLCVDKTEAESEVQ